MSGTEPIEEIVAEVLSEHIWTPRKKGPAECWSADDDVPCGRKFTTGGEYRRHVAQLVAERIQAADVGACGAAEGEVDGNASDVTSGAQNGAEAIPPQVRKVLRGWIANTALTVQTVAGPAPTITGWVDRLLDALEATEQRYDLLDKHIRGEGGLTDELTDANADVEFWKRSANQCLDERDRLARILTRVKALAEKWEEHEIIPSLSHAPSACHHPDHLFSIGGVMSCSRIKLLPELRAALDDQEAK